MAPTMLQLAIGVAAGTALQAPRLAAAWRAGRPLARPIARWMAGAWALGAFAIVPSIFRWAGVPAPFCEGWWMNIFLLNPLVGAMKTGDALLGEAALAALFALQYGVLVAAVRRTRRA